MNTTNERYKLNKELAQMLKGGVIMDVTTPEQAKIAEAAGACAVMALERIPADIRAAGGVSRMSDPKMIQGIQNAVSIPVMAKCRIGHFVEAQVLEAIEIDYIDESEVLSPADDVYHINKRNFRVPFVCGAKDLGEALRRINEGASMIRTKGEPGTGDIVQAVRHMRKMNSEIAKLTSMREDELFEAAKTLQVPYELVAYVHDNGRLPVVNFAAGGVATPADAALMMQLGAEGVEMLLLLADDVLKHLVRYGVLVLRGDARGFVVAVDRTLLQLHGHAQHLLHVGDLPGAERGVHVHVALQEQDAVGELLDVTHLGDRNLAHDLREILVAVVLEMSVEIHVLQRSGDLLAHGIVQQVDAHLILVLCFDCGFHNEKRFCSPTCKTRSTKCRQDVPRRPISTR